MKILIDDGMQIDVDTGIGKYTKYLYESLKKNKNIDDVLLVQNHKFFKRNIFSRIVYLFKISSRKYKINSENYDVAHFTNYAIPFNRSKKVKYAVTIHDLVSYKYAETLPLLYRLYSRFIIKYAIKYSDIVFTVSESVKKEICEYFPKYGKKIHVGYPGFYEEMDVLETNAEFDNKDLLKLKNNFFLYVGTVEKRKNIGFVIEAFLRLKELNDNNYKLVLVGKEGYGYDEFVKLVENSKYKDDVIFTGYVTNEDCSKLYDNASAYVFPTIYEGFGSTQLECMKHHTPLILSNIPTNVEVSGKYGLFFDLNDIDSLIKQMQKIIDGKYNSKNDIADNTIYRYRWENVIEDYIKVYNDINKVKICHVIGDFINGGVESVIYNYFSHIDLSKFDVHIIGHGITVKECADRFVKLGFTIHNVTPKRQSFIKNLKEMNSIIKNNKFDVVHSHMTEWACIPMFLAFLNNVKVRINHSHMAEKPTGLKNVIYYGVRLWLGKLFATDYFACGRDAGIYLFGENNVKNGKVKVINNAIDTKKFSFDKNIREEVRKENKIKDNEIVIGHVGRFFKQKNHKYLIDIFKELSLINSNVRLYLFGNGELFDEVKDYVTELKLSDKVKFMGVRSDIDRWYQAMDLFVLPSLYEGLPVVGVEAQMSGLPCYFADTITDEISINKNTKFISIDGDASVWANIINEDLKTMKRFDKSEIDSKFDIDKNAGWLEEFYLSSTKR